MEKSSIVCITLNILLLPLFICYLFVSSIFFMAHDEDEFGFTSRWESVSYLLSLFSTTGEGFLLCSSDKCRLQSVYVGVVGMGIVFTFVALTAVNLSRVWTGVLSRFTGPGCCRLVLSWLLSLSLLLIWFLAFIMAPSALWWQFGPPPSPNFPEDEQMSFVQCHYAVFVTVTSVGFGDILLLPVEKMPLWYCFSLLSHCFLGSIVAFVSGQLQQLQPNNNNNNTSTGGR